jgi:hypothetical protein
VNILLKVIRVNGEVEEQTVKGDSLERAEVSNKIHELIGADCCDLVNLHDGTFMYLDDNGYAKGLPVNVEATKLYHSVCKAGTTHQILGDVVIVEGD